MTSQELRVCHVGKILRCFGKERKGVVVPAVLVKI